MDKLDTDTVDQTVDQRRCLSSDAANKATHSHPKDEELFDLCFQLQDQDQKQPVCTPWKRFMNRLNLIEKEEPETWRQILSKATATPVSKAKVQARGPTSSSRSTPTRALKGPQQVRGKAEGVLRMRVSCHTDGVVLHWNMLQLR